MFFLPVLSAASPADSAAWKALLHFDGSRSNAREGAFFLSPEGHLNPESEWQATKQLFETDPQGLCRFPARAHFFGLEPGESGPVCERYQTWKKAVSAEGIELVFAAAFLNSPSSMYGHTLLKFPRAGKTKDDELLDYTLNYGADTGSAAGLSYVWLGLTGGFAGNYATAPFYLKVKEYNFVENRDFWVYPLKVTPSELEMLVAHAWEVREIDFPYYFLRKNCSYYLLEFLEVARPGEGLVKSFPLWAVPMDTIRRLEKNNWLGEPRLRPSRQKILSARKSSLSGQEVSQVIGLLEGNSQSASAEVIDAAYDLWRYRTESKNLSKEELAKEADLLRLRKAAGSSLPPKIEELPPHLGHPTNRLGLAGGIVGEKLAGELNYRGTLHDLLANPLGFEPNSELSMGDTRVRFQDGRLFLERFDLLRLRSLAPTESWFPRHAWSFRAAFARAKEMRCEAWRCSVGLLNGGWGASFKLGPVLIFGLAEFDGELGGIFRPNYRISAGPSGGVFTPLWPGARLLAEGDWRLRLLGEKRQKKAARIGLSQEISRRWELRLEGESNRGEREAWLKVFHYF